MYYVYVLQSKRDDNLYIGYTSDLEARVEKHNSGEVKSTQDRTPLELIYYEAYKSKKDAMKREDQLKSMGSQRESLKRRLNETLKIYK